MHDIEDRLANGSAQPLADGVREWAVVVVPSAEIVTLCCPSAEDLERLPVKFPTVDIENGNMTLLAGPCSIRVATCRMRLWRIRDDRDGGSL